MNIDLATRKIKIFEAQRTRPIRIPRPIFQGRIISGYWHRDDGIMTTHRLMTINHQVEFSIAVLDSESQIIFDMIRSQVPVTKTLQINEPAITTLGVTQNGFLLNSLAVLTNAHIEQPMLRDGSIVCDMTWAFYRNYDVPVSEQTLEKVDWKLVGF